MTILQLQQIIRQNFVYIIDGIKDLIPDETYLPLKETDKRYISSNYRINDIIMSVNSIDIYLDIINENITIHDYYTDKKKTVTKHTYHNYIKIIENGKFLHDRLFISTTELIRRSLQNTKFPKMEIAKNVIVNFQYKLTDLSFFDLIIPDFDPSVVFPIYKRFIKEKFNILIPRIKELKEEISDNKAISYAFITETMTNKNDLYSPFDLDDIIKDLDDETVIDQLTLRQCETKLLMTNDWLRRIHYTVLSNIDLANECKRYLLWQKK